MNNIVRGLQKCSIDAVFLDVLGINASAASRRYDKAKRRVADDHHTSEAAANVIRQYTVHKT